MRETTTAEMTARLLESEIARNLYRGDEGTPRYLAWQQLLEQAKKMESSLRRFCDGEFNG